MKHSHFLVILPHFDGNNYAYWKVKMKAFLKSIDKRVWLSIENCWKKDQPLLMVKGQLPKKKQQASTVRLWMQYSMLFQQQSKEKEKNRKSWTWCFLKQNNQTYIQQSKVQTRPQRESNIEFILELLLEILTRNLGSETHIIN